MRALVLALVAAALIALLVYDSTDDSLALLLAAIALASLPERTRRSWLRRKLDAAIAREQARRQL